MNAFSHDPSTFGAFLNSCSLLHHQGGALFVLKYVVCAIASFPQT